MTRLAIMLLDSSCWLEVYERDGGRQVEFHRPRKETGLGYVDKPRVADVVPEGAEPESFGEWMRSLPAVAHAVQTPLEQAVRAVVAEEVEEGTIRYALDTLKDRGVA